MAPALGGQDSTMGSLSSGYLRRYRNGIPGFQLEHGQTGWRVSLVLSQGMDKARSGVFWLTAGVNKPGSGVSTLPRSHQAQAWSHSSIGCIRQPDLACCPHSVHLAPRRVLWAMQLVRRPAHCSMFAHSGTMCTTMTCMPSAWTPSLGPSWPPWALDPVPAQVAS